MVDTRSPRQMEGVNKWVNNKCRGTLSWVTAMGKSHTALSIVTQMLQKHPHNTTCIVVPTIFLKEAFEAKIVAQGIANTDVLVINTFVKQERNYDLIIADEIHLFLSQYAQEFSKLFTISNYRWFLGLSASLTPEEVLRLEELGIPIVDTITLEEARRNNWIAPHRTYNLGIHLTREEKVAYDRAHLAFSQHFSKFSHDFQLAMACVGNREARERHAAFMGWLPTDGREHLWSPQSLGTFANIWHRAMKERKAIVDHAKGKYEVALALIHKFSVPTICFSESTTFASHLASLDPTIIATYHSQIPSTKEEYTVVKTFKTKPDEILVKERKVSGTSIASRAITDFRDSSSSIRVLSTARALDQGADFPELRLGIETSGSGTVRQKVQRTGRVVRKDSSAAENEQQAVYVHIYALDTYEGAKLKRKQKGLKGILEVSNVSQITF